MTVSNGTPGKPPAGPPPNGQTSAGGNGQHGKDRDEELATARTAGGQAGAAGTTRPVTAAPTRTPVPGSPGVRPPTSAPSANPVPPRAAGPTGQAGRPAPNNPFAPRPTPGRRPMPRLARAPGRRPAGLRPASRLRIPRPRSRMGRFRSGIRRRPRNRGSRCGSGWDWVARRRPPTRTAQPSARLWRRPPPRPPRRRRVPPLGRPGQLRPRGLQPRRPRGRRCRRLRRSPTIRNLDPRARPTAQPTRTQPVVKPGTAPSTARTAPVDTKPGTPAETRPGTQGAPGAGALGAAGAAAAAAAATTAALPTAPPRPTASGWLTDWFADEARDPRAGRPRRAHRFRDPGRGTALHPSGPRRADGRSVRSIDPDATGGPWGSQAGRRHGGRGSPGGREGEGRASLGVRARPGSDCRGSIRGR